MAYIRGMQRRALVGALAALAVLGCGRPAELRYEADLEKTPDSAVHAVHDVRLAEVMRGLETLRRERLPTAIDPEEAQARQAREVARVARAMADSASRIADAAPAQLDAAQRAELDDLAARLATLCESLAAEAPSLDVEAQRARLAEIDATCTDCHERFGIPWQR